MNIFNYYRKITLATGFLGNCNSPMSKLKLNWKFSISRLREKNAKKKKKIFFFFLLRLQRSGTEKRECRKSRCIFYWSVRVNVCITKRINWDEKRKGKNLEWIKNKKSIFFLDRIFRNARRRRRCSLLLLSLVFKLTTVDSIKCKKFASFINGDMYKESTLNLL